MAVPDLIMVFPRRQSAESRDTYEDAVQLPAFVNLDLSHYVSVSAKLFVIVHVHLYFGQLLN